MAAGDRPGGPIAPGGSTALPSAGGVEQLVGQLPDRVVAVDADGARGPAVGSAAWWIWLDAPGTRAFRFVCDDGWFSARRERRPGGHRWYARRTVAGRERVAYLGASADLTLDRLVAVARRLGRGEARRRSTGSVRDGPTAGAGALPVGLAPIVGRDGELAAVERSLAAGRIVTLTGPGGAGKTRLAVEIANRLRGAFADGVRFVDLAPLVGSEQVLPAVATAVGVRRGSRPDALAAALRGRELLLILDNVEHVLPAAPAVAALLDACPTLTLLVTGRTTLGLPGEEPIAVGPLPVPDPSQLPSLADLARVPSVALFVARAREAVPGFCLTGENASAVAAVCARLDGLPLALELAAARVRVFEPRELLARLDRPLELLAAPARARGGRHRALRAAMAWSHALLAAGPEALFRRLSVFLAGATLVAVEALAGTLGDDPIAAAADLEALVDHSLVQRQARPEESTRFVMLQTVREYALDQLAAAGEEAAVRDAHAAFFLALAEEARPHLVGPAQRAWLARLDDEAHNFRAALTWLHDSGDGARELRLAAALGRYWHVRGHATDARPWLADALARGPAEASPARAVALDWAGWEEALHGDPARAVALLEESVAVASAIGDDRLRSSALQHLALAAATRDGAPRALARLRDALAAARRVDDPREIAYALARLAGVALAAEDRDAARELVAEALPLAERVGDAVPLVGILNVQAVLALDGGDREAARRLLGQARTTAEQIGFVNDAAGALWSIGDLDRADGDLAAADARYREALALVRDGGGGLPVGCTLLRLGGLAALAGEHARAAHLFGAAEALRGDAALLGAWLPPTHEADVELTRSALGESAFAVAWREGRGWDAARAVAEALRPTSPRPSPRLSAREWEVARLIALGLSNAEVAARLVISERTAEAHAEHIRDKLDVRTRAQIARWVVERQGGDSRAG